MSVDTKKKELIDPFKNGGREWRPHGDLEDVNVHDFVTTEGKAAPAACPACTRTTLVVREVAAGTVCGFSDQRP